MVALALIAASCSVGHGTGEVWGEAEIDSCHLKGAYQLGPSAFFAQTAEQVLRIRVQRGSDIEVRSDGVAVLVEDAAFVKRNLLGQDIQVATVSSSRTGDEGASRVDMTLYMNESCPAERDKTPVALSAVSGTIRFFAIYAPRVDKDEVRISAEFTDVRFEDPRTSERWALLQGQFDFLYVRGSPAQRFP